MSTVVNLQIASFAGLGLPRTLNKPVAASTPTCDVLQQIYSALPNPELGPRLLVSTTDGRRITSQCTDPISSFTTEDSSLLPLRLSTRLCGGKGGFGSQLRAAGGRMSTKKNRDRQNANGSNRNLDGRRLRTVDEAKRLAQYLEMKPEMERKEREERRERWEAVIKAADETEERIKSGKMGRNQGRLDAEYVENKEQAEEKMREAVSRAMRESILQTEKTGSESSEEESGFSSSTRDMHDAADSDSDSGEDTQMQDPATSQNASFFGWDDEYDEDDDDDDEEEREDQSNDDDGQETERIISKSTNEGLQNNDDTQGQPQHSRKSKGKGKAT